MHQRLQAETDPAHDPAKARFDLALAEIAQGRGADARADLHALGGTIPAGDVGLALALAGDRQGAITILVDLVRSGKSDARSRQNLALAFALDGRWREARAMAMQDSTPDKIEGQLAHWAELAKPTATGSTQIASMGGSLPLDALRGALPVTGPPASENNGGFKVYVAPAPMAGASALAGWNNQAAPSTAAPSNSDGISGLAAVDADGNATA